VYRVNTYPSSDTQCKNNGWKAYGVFKNQGDCVSFVATGAQNTPPARRAVLSNRSPQGAGKAPPAILGIEHASQAGFMAVAPR
jgi:hypothetical protein